MTDFLLGFVLGALLYSALQLTLINDKLDSLDSLDERLYSIQLKVTRIGNRLPRVQDADKEEESTDDA